jgi:hypothetical protein
VGVQVPRLAPTDSEQGSQTGSEALQVRTGAQEGALQYGELRRNTGHCSAVSQKPMKPRKRPLRSPKPENEYFSKFLTTAVRALARDSSLRVVFRLSRSATVWTEVRKNY